MKARRKLAHKLYAKKFVSSLRGNRARALNYRRARKVQAVRHQPPKHQLNKRREPEHEVFSVAAHLTFLGNVVNYYENSPNRVSDLTRGLKMYGKEHV